MILSLAIALLMVFSSTDAGEAFTRWGRSVCPTGTHRLFKGYMAGSYHTVNGNGANFVCAHEDPKFVRPAAGWQAGTGRLYGVELELWEEPLQSGLFLKDNVNGGNLYDQDLMCAVCYVADASTHIMITGRPDCGESGFDLQYKGFLASNNHGGNQIRGEYVCLDEAPEGRPGGSGNNNDGVIHPVQVGCGSIPCAPYVDGFELTCAVCTY